MSIAYTVRMNPSSSSSPRFHLGIVTGLRYEAAIAEDAIRSVASPPGDDRVTATCHGPGPARARSAAEALVDIGACALLSFGVAGGCNPDLPSGTVILATGVRDLSPDGAGEILYTNRGWQRRMKSLLLGNVLLEEAMLASVAGPLTDAKSKIQIFRDTGAAAVDMESAAAARVAIAAGIPFMALRVIVDTADRSLPPAAMAGMTMDGAIRTGPVLRALLRRPQDIPGLVGIGIADTRARKALKRTAAVASPLFGGI